MSFSPGDALEHPASDVPHLRDRTTPLHAYDAGLLLLRLSLGLIVASHGSQKLFGWFSGPGLTGTGQLFTSLGYPSGRTMAVIAGLSELLGGLGLASGLLTPLAAAAVVGMMVNAISVKWHGGFFIPNGMEYELVLAAGATALALTGPGRLAADRHVPGIRDHRIGFGLLAVALGVLIAVVVLLLRN
ncbi:DoxX family protein [Streptomyces sp. PA03-3a]|nr:DoxX family protein [Streptomyces sp. PA03-3a]